jgi:glycolate oxidase FAD binding subunit
MDSMDKTESLRAEVKDAHASNRPLVIEGHASKSFYGFPQPRDRQRLNIGGHLGIVDYAPEELVIRARAGTPLSEVNRLLGKNRQLLAFEPPDFEADSTIGGVIASGLSGPRRPYAGSARDFVLGVKLITGTGDVLEFGGQVMKNVAGYDVSRLVTGALGTLGVILDVSLKVLPAPETETSRAITCSRDDFQARLQPMARNFPLSAAAWHDGHLKVRFSGSEAAVGAAIKNMGGEEIEPGFWSQLNTFECFSQARELWRVSVAPASGLFLEEAEIIDWGGGVRWLVDPDFDPRNRLADKDGHATLVKTTRDPLESGVEIFQPLTEPVLGIHRGLKKRFDPAGIFNPDRMYRDF